MLHGEYTITLQDVAIQFGLSINGRPLIGSLNYDWEQLCALLLGITMNDAVLKGGCLSLPWLADQFNNFAHLPDHADEEDLQRYAQAYILKLIGGLVFPDKSNSRVHLMYLPLLMDFDVVGTYSWGAGCLTWLYRQLCKSAVIDGKDIVGPLLLIQIWAWDQFPLLAPQRLHRYENNLGDIPLAVR
ncbi:protein MAIN-LIKE 2-like [Benincasa hispida]|uniref:protein MAIN-LIKE 2-like n=1 Tax=Benincasa hispida TaxID=102211 RepID=UPI001902AC4E|nr:protein MAIN-LIKE 2-like [Benincasa hispida]